MSRVLAGLVALSLAAPSASAQVQVFTTQTPDGATVTGTISVGPGGIPQVPARDAQPARTGTSRIRGRVVDGNAGQPVRRASVRLTSPELRESKTTVTDQDGHYEFRDLPSGRYNLFVTKNGFVSISYGQRRPNEPGRPLDLADKQVADRVDFTLPRGGIIIGRVVDEYGEPVANAMVQPMMLRFVNGERRPMPSGPQSTTPDTGEFRLWGLAPGEYFIAVNARGMNFFEQSDDRSGYLPTYYPGTPTVAEAQAVTLAVGQTATGVDIMLIPARTAQVSGTTMNSKGQPLRGGSVMAMARSQAGMMMGMNGGGPIRADGTWSISGLPPGEYTLRANAQPTAPGVPPEIVFAMVTVGSEDLTGVVLTPMPPIRISGKITLDPPTGWLQPSMLRVMATPKDPGPNFFGNLSIVPVVHDDFTFEAPGQPGAMIIRAMPAQPSGAAPWTVKSVRLDNEDITDSGVDLSAGRDLGGVEIVVTNRMQVLSGSVTNDRGEIASEASVMIFPQNPAQRTIPRFRATARLDQNGRYTVRNLPPGEYLAVAIDYLDSNRSMDPAFLEELSRGAVRLSLTEGDNRTVDLKVTSRQ